MKFNFSGLFSLVKNWFPIASFEDAGITALQDIGRQVIEHSHAPDQLKKLGGDLVNNAPAILGSIVHGTPAQSLVSPEAVSEAKKAAEEAPAI